MSIALPYYCADTPDVLFLDEWEEAEVSDVRIEDSFCDKSVETNNDEECGSLDEEDCIIPTCTFLKSEPLDQVSEHSQAHSKEAINRKKRRQGTHGHQVIHINKQVRHVNF
jgi:hypothetical protein